MLARLANHLDTPGEDERMMEIPLLTTNIPELKESAIGHDHWTDIGKALYEA